MDSKVSGSFSGPPPGAPVEGAEPLADAIAQARDARAQQLADARTPFAPPVPVEPSVAAAAASVAQERNAAADALAAAQAARKAMPAASDSDSPSRGVPRPIADPGKAITGGFGSLGEAQYYAINGFELQEVVMALLDQIANQIPNDLRFSMAITYPKLTVKLALTVEGWAEDAAFVIEKVSVPDKQSPLEVAAARASEVVFVLKAHMREFDEDGVPENPPDRMRESLGLPIPRKQMVQAGAIKTMVDIVPNIDESF